MFGVSKDKAALCLSALSEAGLSEAAIIGETALIDPNAARLRVTEAQGESQVKNL